MSISSVSFEALFRQATAEPSPLPYQARLALNNPLPVLMDVPTGLGKTAGAILAWVWRRRFADDSVRTQTPRRLVYCLPMRVLVEQTFGESVKWLARLGLLAGTAQWTELGSDGLPRKQSRLDRCNDGRNRGYLPTPEATQVQGWAAVSGDRGQFPIAVNLLLGGEDRTDWALWPERDAILIGTQDMLLSRALNRGFAAGWARWPLEFGLLNNDSLWVFDEIQLMSSGLASSLQLDAWRQSLCLRPSPTEFRKKTAGHLARPCQSLWMSATMAKHWLDSAVDWSEHKTCRWESRLRLDDKDENHQRVEGLLKVTKAVQKQPIATLNRPKTKENKVDKADAVAKASDYVRYLAKAIRSNRPTDGLTLVIVNTVDRAVALYAELVRGERTLAVELVHSRFRPIEREKWNLQAQDGHPRIVVATQVVEAGVDLSAKVLFTELAPWASLVQRFGRCARYPEDKHGKVFWLDLDLGSPKQPVDHWAKPYESSELVAARKQLLALDDVGLRSLRNLRSQQDDSELFPYEPRFVPRDKDLFDLFDTTPDLTGADVDISRFIRDGQELDIQVFWREIPADGEPHQKDRPHRRELCPVPFYLFRKSLPALRKAGRIWRRNYRKGWEPVDSRDADQAYPGQVFLLEQSCGGYSPVLGWTGDTSDRQFDLSAPAKATVQDEEEEADDLSQLSQWLNVLSTRSMSVTNSNRSSRLLVFRRTRRSFG